jgi:hypothetical protein
VAFCFLDLAKSKVRPEKKKSLFEKKIFQDFFFLTLLMSMSTTTTERAILSTSWPLRYSLSRVPVPIIGILHAAEIGMFPFESLKIA